MSFNTKKILVTLLGLGVICDLVLVLFFMFPIRVATGLAFILAVISCGILIGLVIFYIVSIWKDKYVQKIKEYKICWICGCTDMIPTIDGDWLCPSCDKVDKDKIK